MCMVELVVTDIMSKASDHRAHVLLLSEKQGLRKIIVALGFLEAQSIAFALRDIKTDRPLTHDLFGGITSAFGIVLQYVLPPLQAKMPTTMSVTTATANVAMLPITTSVE